MTTESVRHGARVNTLPDGTITVAQTYKGGGAKRYQIAKTAFGEPLEEWINVTRGGQPLEESEIRQRVADATWAALHDELVPSHFADAVSFHDAGQYVVGRALGLPIDPELRLGSGRNIGDASPVRGVAERSTEAATCIHAGIFADGFRKPNRDFGPANRRWRFELDAAKQWIADAGDEAAIQRRAMELVAKHWPAIERVAHALLDHGELGAAEAAQIADVSHSL